MPLYEYECEACAHRFERIQKFSDPPVDTCPTCAKGPVRKLLSSPAIQFRGSGFYITDYARKGGTDKSSSNASSSTEANKTETKTESKSDTSSSDAKPAAKTE
jgi:putative FmdB family regulatory protein